MVEILNGIISVIKEWGELFFAALAFVLSVIAMIKASKAEKLQTQINKLELKIKENEISKIEKEKEYADYTCVEARVVKIGKNQYRMKVWNSGNAPAYNVSANFEDDPQIIIMNQEKQPYEELEPNKNYELILIVHSGSASKFKITTNWEDGNKQKKSKTQMGDI